MVTKSPKAAPGRRVERTIGPIDAYFQISARGSTVGREIRGGIVTFFTMAYIIALNPLIIGTAPDGAGNLLGGLPYADRGRRRDRRQRRHRDHDGRAATALVAGVMTILMGVFGRFPIGIAAGLGLNALLAFTIAPQMTWPQAMGLIVIEGIADRGPGADRLPDRGVQGGAALAADRDLGRHRPVHRLRRAGRRRHRPQAGGRPAGGAGHQRLADRLADAGLRDRPVRRRDPVRAPDQGRDADLHPRRHRGRGADRAGRPDRAARPTTTRRAGRSTCPSSTGSCRCRISG